jgi:adenylyltransferase/sulfurtransferase
VHPRDRHEKPVWDRQEKIPGFDQRALKQLRILLVGAGGLNGEIGEGLVRKGVGEIMVVDPDWVELSNLNRQRFFPEDIDQNKAVALAKNLSKEGAMGTKLTAFGCSFQEALQRGLLSQIPVGHDRARSALVDVVICGVDNSRTRIAASLFGLRHKIPVIFTAVSADADHGYVFVQKPGGACFACLFPDEVEDYSDPCPDTPAVKDILKVVAGLSLYAVDTLAMKRKRNWDIRMIFLNGEDADWKGRVSKREMCALCNTTSKKV